MNKQFTFPILQAKNLRPGFNWVQEVFNFGETPHLQILAAAQGDIDEFVDSEKFDINKHGNNRNERKKRREEIN